MKKIVGLIVSFLMILSLVLASCTPKVTEEKEVVTTPTEEKEVVTTPTEKKEVVTTPTEKKGVVPAGPEMVKLSLKKLDGTVVEKMVEKPRYGGIINTAYWLDPNSFDPYDCQAATGTLVTPLLYEKLQIGDYTRGPAGTNEFSFTHFCNIPRKYRIGHIAESWEQPDAHTVIWHIRKGIHFQNVPPVNGRELTADDVVYTILRMKSSPRIAPAYYGNVESIVATDKYTVVEKLKDPDYDQIEFTGWYTVTVATFAREMVEKFGDLAKAESACGTGPWMLDNYVRGSVLAYKRNPDYWKKDPFFPENTLPYADGVKILVIPDMSTRIAALRTGKLDFLPVHLTGIAAWQDSESLKKTNPEILQMPYVDTGCLVSINLRVDKPPFDNILVRQAAVLAIDQKALISDYMRGNGEPNNFPMMREWGEEVWTPLDKMPTEPTLPGSRCSVRELVIGGNPEKAKQLLAEAGYPNGFKTDVICTPTEVDLTSMVAAWWKDIGIDLEIHVKEEAVKAAIVTKKPRDFPEAMAVQSVRMATQNNIWSAQFTKNGTFNVGNIVDPHIDQTYSAVIAERDYAKQCQLNKDLALYVLEQAYKVVGPNPHLYNFWQPWLKNCDGMTYLSSWGQYQSTAYYWIDRDMREEMTGRR